MSDVVIYERSTVVDGDGQVFQTTITRFGLVRFTWLDTDETGMEIDNVVFLQNDAIAAARAILKHFNGAEA